MKTKTIVVTFLMVAVLLIALGCSKGVSSQGQGLTGATVDGVVEDVKTTADNAADSVSGAVGEVTDTVKDSLNDGDVDNEDTEAAGGDDKPTLHRVKISEFGFDPQELTLNVGDSIEWVNARKAKAMIVGIRGCSYLKSPVFSTGDSFEYEFIKADTCTAVDGVYTKVLPMKLTIVE